MSDLAVKGCDIQIISGQQASSIEVITPPSSSNFVGENGIYFGDISVLLTDITQGNNKCASGTITISGTANNVLNTTDSKKAVQEGDTGTATLEFTNTSSGATSMIPVVIKVVSAGQTDVSAT